jgi:hypothetical protein
MFPLWEFQKEMILSFEANRFVICKMPRQVGKTTTVAAYLLWKIVFNEEYSIAILANKDRQAREILGRIQLMFEHLPKWLQMGVTEWNKGNIKLENGSEILASATSSSARSQRRQSGLEPTGKTIATWSKSEQPSRRLSQAELNAWWPFTRLDPKLFPKPIKQNLDFEEEALL